MMNTILIRALALWAAGALAHMIAASPASERNGASSGVVVKPITYHGWAHSFLLSNGKAEVTVVPAVGRVMQFGFAGEEGVFWENRALDGQALDASAQNWSTTEWVNFGGDKAWPSPEAEWGKYTRRNSWRPPPAFDAMPVDARVEGADVILTSPVDPFLGVRTHRRVHLDPEQAILTVTTTYELVSGDPKTIGVWTITQLKDPVSIFAPLPQNTKFTNSFTLLGKEPPPDLRTLSLGITTGDAKRNVLRLSRDPKAPHKIGTEASTLLWIGEKAALRIDSERFAQAEYPDQGSSAEIYTNSDPLRYIELEMLGPLRKLKAGDRIHHTNTYRLFRRSETSPDAEAHILMK